MPSTLSLDDSEFPIVVATFGDTISNEHWEEYNKWIVRLLERNTPFAVVNNHIAGGSPNSTQRAHALETVRRIGPEAFAPLRVSIIVTGSALVRGALTAMSWVLRSPIETKVCSTVSEGFGIAKKALNQQSSASA